MHAIKAHFFSKENSCSACSQQQRVPTKKLRTILKANKKEIHNYCCCYSLLKNQKHTPKKPPNPNKQTKYFPQFYSYIDMQISVGLLLASAAGSCTSMS